MNCDNFILLVIVIFSVFVIDMVFVKDYYKILGVFRDVSDRQIKKVFRKFVVKYYFDKNKVKDVEVKFCEIVEGRQIMRCLYILFLKLCLYVCFFILIFSKREEKIKILSNNVQFEQLYMFLLIYYFELLKMGNDILF